MSNPTIDALHAAAQRAGAVGGKIAGAGGGDTAACSIRLTYILPTSRCCDEDLSEIPFRRTVWHAHHLCGTLG